MEAGYNHVPCRFSSFSAVRRYTRHSPHLKSWHPKVEKAFSLANTVRKKLCVCLCVCAWTFPIEVKLVLFQHITGTVSSEATSDMGYWI